MKLISLMSNFFYFRSLFPGRKDLKTTAHSLIYNASNRSLATSLRPACFCACSCLFKDNIKSKLTLFNILINVLCHMDVHCYKK